MKQATNTLLQTKHTLKTVCTYEQNYNEQGILFKYQHIPGHVTRGGEDSRVIDEATRGEVASVTLQLFAYSDVALPSLQTVNGADVVQSTTSNKTSRRGIGTCHHPAGPQWNGMDLCVC